MIEQLLAAGLRNFGELRISAAPGGYELRHRDDEHRPPESLESFDDPERASEIARYDDFGEYRPLKTAPTLRHGWRLAVADRAALRLAMDLFYPGRLAALEKFQKAELSTTPLRDTLARQTGMYRVANKIADGEADGLVARFCRSDGGCLRTILWKRDATGAPATAQLPPEKFDPAHDQTGRGEETIPLLCQEACNLLVAEARKVVKAADAARS